MPANAYYIQSSVGCLVLLSQIVNHLVTTIKLNSLVTMVSHVLILSNVHTEQQPQNFCRAAKDIT